MTCKSDLEQLIADGQLYSLNTCEPGVVVMKTITSSDGLMLLFEPPELISAIFRLAVTPISNVKYTFAILRVNEDNSVTTIASSLITTPNASLPVDFQAGTYVFCIRAILGRTYELAFQPDFVGFPQSRTFAATLNSGSLIETIDLGEVVGQITCKGNMTFEVIEGALPKGLTLSDNGVLQGIINNIDEEDSDYSPSFAWFNDLGEPAGMQFRFKVKVSLKSNPELFDTAWYCIRVHNNWSQDSEFFIEQELEEEVLVVERERPVVERNTLCPVVIKIPNQLANVSPIHMKTWFDRIKGMDISKECKEIQDYVAALRESSLFQTDDVIVSKRDDVLIVDVAEETIKARDRANNLLPLLSNTAAGCFIEGVLV